LCNDIDLPKFGSTAAINGNFTNLNASPGEVNGEPPADGTGGILAAICGALCKDTPFAEMFGPPQAAAEQQATSPSAAPITQNGNNILIFCFSNLSGNLSII
jgi:hypothetical protein